MASKLSEDQLVSVSDRQEDNTNETFASSIDKRGISTMKSTTAKEVHQPFVTDIKELRRRARAHMEMGAVTSAYTADREAVIRILNDVLATELVCILRYKRHYYMATGIHAQAVAEEFLEHATEEQRHADIVAL